MSAISSVSHPRRRVFGVSLKMYMGLQQTRQWIADLKELVQHGLPADLDLFIVPNFLSLCEVNKAIAGMPIALGAQDVFWEDRGSFTGEVSAPMLAEAGCSLVEIGHAERRRLFGETDEVVAQKVAAAVRSKLVPILCVGEPKHAGPQAAIDFCLNQLETATSGIRPVDSLIVAYEPVWAIGAAEPASPEFITTVAQGLGPWIAPRHNTRLIYGGSAKPGLFSQLGTAVDGLFLGRFAHDMHALEAILREATRN